MDVAQLGIRVDSRPVKTADADLKKLAGSARTAETATERLGRASMTAGKSTASAARSASAMTRAFSNTNGIRMAALQLGQVAQQGAVTGNYLQALSIQLPDLLLGFGTFGALAGVAAGALGPLALNLLSSRDNAKALSDTLDNLTNASRSYIDAAEQARRSVQDLTADFGANAEAAREALQALAEFKQQAALDAVISGSQEIAEEMGKAFKQLSALDKLIDLGGTEAEIAILRRNLQGTLDDLNLAEQGARELQGALAVLEGAQSLDAVVAAGQNLQRVLEDVYGSVANIPPELSAAAQAILQAQLEALKLQSNMDGSVDAAQRLGAGDFGVISSAANEAERMAAAFGIALSRAVALSNITPAMADEDVVMSQAILPTAATRQSHRQAVERFNAEMERLNKVTTSAGGGIKSLNEQLSGGKIQGAVNTLLSDMQQEIQSRIEPFRQAGQSIINTLLSGLFSGNMNIAQAAGGIGQQLLMSSLGTMFKGGGLLSGLLGSAALGPLGAVAGLGMGLFSMFSAQSKKRQEERAAERARLEALRNVEQRAHRETTDRMQELSDTYRDLGISVTEAEKEIGGILTTYDEMRDVARELGYTQAQLLEIEKDRARALDIMAESVRTALDQELAEIENSAAAGIDAIRRSQVEQLREAAAVGVDLVKVEEIYGKKRLKAVQDFSKQQLGALLSAGMVDRALSAFESTRRSILGQVEEISSGFERVTEAFGAFRSSIDDFINGLLLDNRLSVLDPREQLQTAERIFEETLAAARGGDADAIDRLQDVSRQFLDRSMDFNAATLEFGADFERVTSALRGFGISDAFAETATTSERQLSVLEQIRDILASADPNITRLSGLFGQAGMDTGQLESLRRARESVGQAQGAENRRALEEAYSASLRAGRARDRGAAESFRNIAVQMRRAGYLPAGFEGDFGDLLERFPDLDYPSFSTGGIMRVNGAFSGGDSQFLGARVRPNETVSVLRPGQDIISTDRLERVQAQVGQAVVSELQSLRSEVVSLRRQVSDLRDEAEMGRRQKAVNA